MLLILQKTFHQLQRRAAEQRKCRYHVRVAACLCELIERRFIELAIGPHRNNPGLRLCIVAFILKASFVLDIFRNRRENALNLIATFRPSQCEKASTHRLGRAQQQLSKQP